MLIAGFTRFEQILVHPLPECEKDQVRILNSTSQYFIYFITFRALVPVTEFTNTKLTAKVNRQLQDPIVIMTSNLPTWLKVRQW